EWVANIFLSAIRSFFFYTLTWIDWLRVGKPIRHTWRGSNRRQFTDQKAAMLVSTAMSSPGQPDIHSPSARNTLQGRGTHRRIKACLIRTSIPPSYFPLVTTLTTQQFRSSR